METIHKIFNKSSIDMSEIADNSVNLVVTSPPYPMVEMWDECFKSQSTFVEQAFDKEMYNQAWLEMHYVLDKVWKEVVRVVKPGGFVCINIGDATRTFNGEFQLFSNHSKIIQYFIENGFVCLPDILWRKRTNAPNKFMGSGMYPAGAYVTFEHENILIFRKGGKRTFTEEEKKIRQESAYFYNERNLWFSDV
jgi:DNA modification methylase